MILDYFYGQAGELFSFYRIPKALFQEQRFQNLSTDAKTLYGILLDRMSLSVKNGWLDKQNRVFIIFTMENDFLQRKSQHRRTSRLDKRRLPGTDREWSVSGIFCVFHSLSATILSNDCVSSTPQQVFY